MVFEFLFFLFVNYVFNFDASITIKQNNVIENYFKFIKNLLTKSVNTLTIVAKIISQDFNVFPKSSCLQKLFFQSKFSYRLENINDIHPKQKVSQFICLKILCRCRISLSHNKNKVV